MDELQLGIQAAKSGDHAAARAHLVRAVQRDPNNETAWIWMAQVMDDPARRVDCLKQALRINPQNTLIQRAIQALTAAAPASSVSEPEPVAAVELEPEPETPWAAAPAWDAAASWAAEPSPEAEAAAEPESETPWAAAPAWDAAASWAAEPSSEAEAAAEPESETPWTAAPAWDAAASWAATSAAETEAEPESPWDLKPVWEEEAEAEPTAETPLWAPGTFETEEAEEESVAPATLWGLEPLNAGTSTEEEAPAAAAIWDFTSAWSDTADEEESALIPPWQGETAEDADAGWSLDTALGLSGESAPAEPEVASEAADEGTEWNFEQLWGEEEKIEVTPPELGAGAPPALEKEAPIAPAFILDDDLKQVLEGVPETPAPMAPAAPFTVPVTESAPPQRVSLLDRRRMSYFQPPAPAPELVAPGGAVELFDEEPAPESAPVAAVKEKRGRRAKQRSAKRTEEASVSAEAAPTSRRRFRLLDARTLIGIFGMLDVAIISALLIAFMTREVTKPPAARVAAQCAALDRTGFTLQTPWEVSGTLSASTVYTAGAKYLIRETLVISPEQRLLLEPGAQLVFEPGAGLEVYGALYACGTADAPVLLTSERQTPGSWAGIRFHGVGPDVWLSHAEIYFAGERALYLENSAPVLANVTIANSARFPISVEGEVFPDLSMGLTLRDNPFHGVEIRQGALRSGKVFWPKQDIPYIIAGLLTVGADTTLDIAPGAIVKVWTGPYRVSGLWVRGILHAEGAHFTSVYDSRETVGGKSVQETRAPRPGDWGGITFHQSSDECTLRDATIAYAGQKRGAITLRASSPNLTQVTIADSAGYPISVDGDSLPTLSKVRLRDNHPNALELRAGSLLGAGAQVWEPLRCEILPSEHPTETFSLQDIMFAEMTPPRATAPLSPTLASGQTPTATVAAQAAGATPRPTLAAAQRPYTDTLDVGEDVPLVRVIQGDFTVAREAALTLKPGVVVKFAASGRLVVQGTLDATGGGAEGARIVFTSLHDDDYGGNTDGLTRPSAVYDWGGVVFDQSGGDSVMQNVWVRYAPIQVENGAPRLSNNYISDNLGPAVALSPDAQPELLNNTLVNNGLNAVAIMTGTVTREQNWARLGELKDQAVRVLVGRVVVTDGVTLRIGGGTVIKADTAGQLVVSGTLRIPGQAHLPVVLTSLRDDSVGGNTDGGILAAAPGDWRGLVVGAGADVQIDHTSLRYAEVGVTLYGGVGVTVTEGRLQITGSRHALWCDKPSEISTGFLIEENQANERACPTRW